MGIKVKIGEKEKNSGVWWVFVEYKNKVISKTKVGSKAKAEKAAQGIEASLVLKDLGILHQEQKQEVLFPFHEYAGIWLGGYVKHSLKSSTYRGYESILRIHLNPVFGKRSLEQITRPEIKAFLYQKLDTGLSRNRVKRIKAVLSGIFSHAVEDGMIQINPAKGLDKFFTSKDDALKTKINPYTAPELEVYLETMKQSFPVYYPFFLTLALTGMRLSEALALKWEALDFQRSLFEVQINLGEKKEIITPKTGKTRLVSMTPGLSEVLQQFKVYRKEQTIKEGWVKMPEWVFVNSKGNPLDRGNLTNRVHNKVYEKAGLKRTRIHDLRHSYATIRISAGHSISDVSKQLGHSSIKITIDTYYHWMPDHNLKEVSELDALMKI